MMATTFNALRGLNEYGEEVSYQMNGHISVKRIPDVGLKSCSRRLTMEDLPLFSGPGCLGTASADIFGRIRDSTARPTVHSVETEFNRGSGTAVSAVLEAAHADLDRGPPGQEIVRRKGPCALIAATVWLRRIPVRVPTSVSPGPLPLSSSHGDTGSTACTAGPSGLWPAPGGFAGRPLTQIPRST